MRDEEILANVKLWRQASPAIVSFWYGLQDAAYAAVLSPGKCFQYQAPATRFGQPPAILYGVKGDILFCRLPSGRMLNYHKAAMEYELTYDRYGQEKWRPRLTYWGNNSDYKKGPKGWMKLDTWGGKLTENVVQAVARDILTHSMPALDSASYPIVLHVHDEIVSEVPAGAGSIEEFERIMSTMPPWAAGWPVKAAGGWRGNRYRKD